MDEAEDTQQAYRPYLWEKKRKERRHGSMYQIQKRDGIYCIYYKTPCGLVKGKMACIFIGDEKALIRYLAAGFKQNRFLSYDINTNGRFAYEYLDGYGRKIEPGAYRVDAWNYFSAHIRNAPAHKYNWRAHHTYRGEFRREPVEGIHKMPKFLHSKRRRVRHLIAISHNPEHKGFGRRDADIDTWDLDEHYDKPCHSWKEQRKVRHQWMRK